MATGKHSAHRKKVSFGAVVLSPETRNRVFALAGSGVALSMIAGTSGASVNPTAMLDVSGATNHAANALTANKAVDANDVEWTSGSSIDNKPVEVKVAPVAPGISDDSFASEAPPASVDGIIATGAQYLGRPYVWGSGGPSSFDCSGFVSYVYRLHGKSLPHQSRAILNAGTRISPADAVPGDVLYWPGHVGLYAGDGKILDASPGRGIAFQRMYGHPVFLRF